MVDLDFNLCRAPEALHLRLTASLGEQDSTFHIDFGGQCEMSVIDRFGRSFDDRDSINGLAARRLNGSGNSQILRGYAQDAKKRKQNEAVQFHGVHLRVPKST